MKKFLQKKHKLKNQDQLRRVQWLHHKGSAKLIDSTLAFSSRGPWFKSIWRRNKQWYHCIGWQLRGFMGNFVLFLFFLSDPTWWPLFLAFFLDILGQSQLKYKWGKFFSPTWIWAVVPWNQKPVCYQWATLTPAFVFVMINNSKVKGRKFFSMLKANFSLKKWISPNFSTTFSGYSSSVVQTISFGHRLNH